MVFLIVVIALIIVVSLFMQQRKFGRLPSGERLQKIQDSPNFKDGKFQNLSFTPDLAEGETYFKIIKKVLLEKDKRSKPSAILPSQKTDLFTLQPEENVIVWFGHSSYFIQVDGKKILVDPVFSGAASPIKETTRSFPGSDVYSTDDIPEIDFLFISHDHWDHLDYETVLKLKLKIKTIITGLGTAEHFEYWGFDPEIIVEKDWNMEFDLEDGFTVHTTPARHFSGRSFKRNNAIWTSFVLQTPTRRIFIGGDSGFDMHFEQIGKDFGPFDLAILECGQYNESWKYIHTLPHEIIPAAKNLKAKMLMPVHWGKFALANHAWDEPILKITEYAKKANMPLLTPMIGQKVNLDKPGLFTEWWKTVD